MKKERNKEGNQKRQKKMIIRHSKIQYHTHKSPSVELPLSYLNPFCNFKSFSSKINPNITLKHTPMSLLEVSQLMSSTHLLFYPLCNMSCPSLNHAMSLTLDCVNLLSFSSYTSMPYSNSFWRISGMFTQFAAATAANGT